MSLHCNPLIYLNMGGEMLYVLQQRLKAQKINSRKTAIVLDDITAALVHPKMISAVFTDSPISSLSWVRSTLETIALCSIMRLDQNSMNKLFDLMMMMVKFQLSTATGPREIVLLTLNHVDAFRGMITRSGTHERITVIHELLIKKYGKLTCNGIWGARNECLDLLRDINVRVSILLKLGLQNEDTSFNLNPRNYNEKFDLMSGDLGAIELLEIPQNLRVGSLQLIGERVTFLGRNIYTMNYSFTTIKPQKEKVPPSNRDKMFIKDKGTKAELGMLAAQLGNEDTSSTRTFSLDLFDDIDVKTDDQSDEAFKNREGEDQNEMEDIIKINDEYKNKLENICADFLTEDGIENKVSLLQLLDENSQ
uniref:Oxidored-nitro domain-like protein n=1 Tax=Glyptapanteles flavicoxis TaxID=463051 RepID=B7S835_9HYME|nr:oxidored-nitro domain-like protein [Glyptapanteles flavicoxis]